MIHLVARFPALERLPRATLGTFPSPVQLVDALPGGGAIWVKRDDLNAPEMGGNKVRTLELLLAGLGPGDTVLTVGGEGSTHVLATAAHAGRLGARTVAVRWPHEMTPIAREVAAEAARRAEIVAARSVVGGLARAWWIRRRRVVRWVPIGGSTALGALGHANAALELVAQARDGLLPLPRRVVVPLGSGGTSAGLALGFAVAGVDVEVVGARVGPRIAVNRHRLLALAESARRLLAREAGAPVPAVRADRVRVAHDAWAGAYGRPHPAADAAAALLAARGLPALDATYCAKAAAVALALAAREPGDTLFWLTFDGRWMGGGAIGDGR